MADKYEYKVLYQTTGRPEIDTPKCGMNSWYVSSRHPDGGHYFPVGDWDVTLTFTRKPFVPGLYGKYKDATLLKAFRKAEIYAASKADDLPDLLPGYEWRRVEVTEVGDDE